MWTHGDSTQSSPQTDSLFHARLLRSSVMELHLLHKFGLVISWDLHFFTVVLDVFEGLGFITWFWVCFFSWEDMFVT